MSVRAPPRPIWCSCRYARLNCCNSSVTERIAMWVSEWIGRDHPSWGLQQAHKADAAQQRLADALPPFDPHSGVAEAVVVGCGPAGLSLAAELANRGVRAVLIGKCSELCKTPYHIA